MATTLVATGSLHVPPWIQCGKELRARREKLGLTLGDVAVESDVPLPIVAQIERGKIHCLDLSMISFFHLVMTVFAFPQVICEEMWDDSTQYAELFRSGGRITLDPVRPLRRRN